MNLEKLSKHSFVLLVGLHTLALNGHAFEMVLLFLLLDIVLRVSLDYQFSIVIHNNKSGSDFTSFIF